VCHWQFLVGPRRVHPEIILGVCKVGIFCIILLVSLPFELWQRLPPFLSSPQGQVLPEGMSNVVVEEWSLVAVDVVGWFLLSSIGIKLVTADYLGIYRQCLWWVVFLWSLVVVVRFSLFSVQRVVFSNISISDSFGAERDASLHDGALRIFFLLLAASWWTFGKWCLSFCC
jgi:hypothetical protein